MYFKPAAVISTIAFFGAALAAPLSTPVHTLHSRAVTVGQWQFTGEVITLESPPLPPVPNPKPKGAAKTAYNKAVTKAKAAQGKATERTALQHGVQEATQRLLDQAQSTGGVQIPNGITVNIWTTWHDHNDRNHTTFKFTNQGLCGGDCVGHAYATPTKTGLAGRLFNAHHDVIYGPKDAVSKDA